MALMRFCTSSTPSTASFTAAAPASPLASARAARSAWREALPAICEAVRASCSMAAVISTTDAACCEEADASSAAISLTASEAAATSIELSWICCASRDSASLAAREISASLLGRPRACSTARTRSPAPSWSKAPISSSSSFDQSCRASGNWRSARWKWGKIQRL